MGSADRLYVNVYYLDPSRKVRLYRFYKPAWGIDYVAGNEPNGFSKCLKRQMLRMRNEFREIWRRPADPKKLTDFEREVWHRSMTRIWGRRMRVPQKPVNWIQFVDFAQLNNDIVLMFATLYASADFGCSRYFDFKDADRPLVEAHATACAEVNS